MRCALCSSTENLLVNVVNDNGLILIFCQDCEDTPTLEAAARLAVENEKLKVRLEMLSQRIFLAKNTLEGGEE